MELDLKASSEKEPNHTDDKMSSSLNRQAYATPATTRLKSDYDINVIRLIGQHLNSLGLKQTVDFLLRETGMASLDHPLADRIQRHIMAGEFDEASSLVEELADLVVAPHTQTGPQPESSKSHRLQKFKATGMDDALRSTENSLNNNTSSSSNSHSSNSNNNNKRKCASSPRISDKKQIMNAMRLAIAEQKYLELLEDKQRMHALRCLQSEITPNVASTNRDSLPRLATLLLCRSSEDLKQRANWPGKGHQSRQLVIDKIRNHVPPLLLLPAGRLGTLLNQASQLQRERCAFHIESLAGGTIFNPNHVAANNETKNENHSPMLSSDNNGQLGDTYFNKQTNGHCATATKVELPSTTPSSSSSSMSLDCTSCLNTNHSDLVHDHACSSDKFPLQKLHDYDHHKTEVWYSTFSPDGLKLATGGLGGKVRIWQLDPVKQELSFKCTFDCSANSVGCLSWSPDGAYLLACGAEERSNLSLINVKKGELQSTISYSSEQELIYSYTTCSWHMSGKRFAAASLHGTLQMFDLDCNQIGRRDAVRVQCLSFLHKDPKYVLAADIQNRIRAYDLDDTWTRVDENIEVLGDRDLIEENFPIISFVVSSDDKYIAVNLQTQGIHLWDYQTATLMRVFSGVSQRSVAIYSSFSSLPYPIFLASGSEDGNVYIYNINKLDHPIIVLSGHSKCVNCVSWNPKYPEFLVSVSDDRCIKLWGPVANSCGQQEDGIHLDRAQDVAERR